MDLLAEADFQAPYTSMRSLSKRPNRSMLVEAQYTSAHTSQTLAQPLRYKKIEFVRALTVYDPSRDLQDTLLKLKSKDALSEDMRRLNVDTQIASPEQTEDSTDGELQESTVVDESKLLQQIDCVSDGLLDLITDGYVQSPEKSSEAIDDQDENYSEAIDAGQIEHDVDSGSYLNDDYPSDSPAESNDSETSILLHDLHDAATQTKSIDDLESDLDSLHSSDMEDLFEIDESGDADVLAKLKIQNVPVLSLLHEKRYAPKPKPHKSHLEPIPLEHEPYLAVGGVVLRTTVDKLGNTTAIMPRKKVSYSELPEIQSDESTDDENAFEDYKSQIFAAMDYEDDLDDEMNSAYISSGCEGPDIDDYISSEDGLGETNLNSDEEGLEEILHFARQQQQNRNSFEFPQTQTLRKKGSGRKQRLELGSELELELRESLMEQFQYQKQSRKDKKAKKKQKAIELANTQHDLKVKYEYSMHIQDMKQELELLLHDASRESVSFPPLDGHGNKTVSKLAGHYNMKCSKCGGNGLKMFMKISKTKKTFRYIPAYDQIGYIMRQRPIFKRTDVAPRTKEEQIQSGDLKSRGPKSNAFVKEGDIVGGKAPEIDVNNIGRQLLEKLGWLRGEGLGAHGNKGISEPLTATVKRSKLGLK